MALPRIIYCMRITFAWLQPLRKDSKTLECLWWHCIQFITLSWYPLGNCSNDGFRLFIGTRGLAIILRYLLKILLLFLSNMKLFFSLEPNSFCACEFLFSDSIVMSVLADNQWQAAQLRFSMSSRYCCDIPRLCYNKLFRCGMEPYREGDYKPCVSNFFCQALVCAHCRHSSWLSSESFFKVAYPPSLPSSAVIQDSRV